MMGLTRQTQVTQGLDRLAGGAMHKSAQAYAKGVNKPLVTAIRGAKSFAGLARALSPALVKRMDTSDAETVLADSMTQAGMIGATSAEPAENVETSKGKAVSRQRGSRQRNS